MEIVLTRPSYDTHLITPPLGLGYLAAYVKRAGFPARIVDGLRLGCEPEELARRCDAPVVGISCMTAYMPEVIELSAALKRRGATVILGGPHPTGLPHGSLQATGADYAVLGEGEITLVELLQRLSEGEPGAGIPGVVTAGVEAFSRRPVVPDLDAFPFPDWDQIAPASYPPAPHGGLIKSFPVAPIVTSRGCPFTCTFCASPAIWGGGIRFRSVDNVLAEIHLLRRRYGIRELHIEDDNFTLRPPHARSICERLLSDFGGSLSWALTNGTRVETINPEMARVMRRAGCYMIAFGIESGDQEILDGVDKTMRLENVRKAIDAASDAGMLTQGFFIFGLPGETAESIERTIRFASESRLDRAQFLLLDVFPGTPIWDQLHQHLRVDPQKRYRSYREITWQPPTVDAETLAKAQPRAFRRFFFRSPRRILQLLKLFKLRQARFVLKRIADFHILGGAARSRPRPKDAALNPNP